MVQEVEGFGEEACALHCATFRVMGSVGQPLLPGEGDGDRVIRCSTETVQLTRAIIARSVGASHCPWRTRAAQAWMEVMTGGPWWRTGAYACTGDRGYRVGTVEGGPNNRLCLPAGGPLWCAVKLDEPCCLACQVVLGLVSHIRLAESGGSHKGAMSAEG